MNRTWRDLQYGIAMAPLKNWPRFTAWNHNAPIEESAWNHNAPIEESATIYGMESSMPPLKNQRAHDVMSRRIGRIDGPMMS
ncbi:hypothetical protein AMTR_s00138p00066680 [Amborella trichopoda]|uniref:Uncharacterized protein n=1 Tax=Amborella trichopoda TaxID=13333 RepID=W1NDQ4_AMBTC|nr:hypothetical protein AMTR_s00138p00066680 [Amborella trichopoda]